MSENTNDTGVYFSDYYKTQGSAKLSEATTEYESKKTKKKKSFGEVVGKAVSGITSVVNKTTSTIATAKNTINSTIDSVKSGIESFQKGLMDGLSDFQSKYNLTNLLEKVGLGADNPIMQALSSIGLSPSILDNWATDLASGITSFADEFISDISPLQMMGIFKSFTDFNLYDKALLNTVVIPLSKLPDMGFIGSGEGQINYLNELLKCCLHYDLPETLEYLDEFNGTLYNSENKMYRRGNYAAKVGCYAVPQYVCEKLYSEYKENVTGTASDDPAKAFACKQMIVSIFKDVLVHGYSNFTPSAFDRFVDSCSDILKNYSYYGTTDATFNGKFLISDSDIDTLAPIVTVDMDRYIKMNRSYRSYFKDPGLDYPTSENSSDWTANVKYIDVRNSFIKTLYVKMANDSDVPTPNRLVNTPLHKRLSKTCLTTFQKSYLKATKTMSNNRIGKNAIKVINVVANGGMTDSLGIYNVLVKLQNRILKTPEEVFGGVGGSSFLNLTQLTNDVGEWNNYDTTEDTSIDKEEKESNIRNIANDEFNSLLPTAYKAIDASITDFMAINITGLKNNEIQALVNKLRGINSSYVLCDTFRVMRLDINSATYSIVNEYQLYTLKKDKYSELGQAFKHVIQLWSLAYYMVTNYSEWYSFGALCSMYGEDKVTKIYKTNDDGEQVLDEKGNSILLSTSTSPTEDKELKEILEKLYDKIIEITNYCKSIISGKEYTMTFNNMGIGESPVAITNIKSYSVLGQEYSPTLTDPNNNFIFIGWTKDVLTEELFDFNNSYIIEDITLYAVWMKAENFITNAKLAKTNNSTLADDIYATIDNVNGCIIFPIKTKEKTDGDRYIISLNTSVKSTSDINTGDIVILDKNRDGTRINVTSDHGNTKSYYLRYVEVEDNSKRISYSVENANLINYADSELSFSSDSTKNISITLSKFGYEFKGWYYNSTLEGTKVESIDKTNENDFIILYPLFVEKSYDISYFDKYGTRFTGVHETEYPTKVTYANNVKLDNPTKENYVFMGWHLNYQCTDEVVDTIPRFSVSNNINLYADWMDAELWQNRFGFYIVNGLKFKLTDLVFYTKYILEDKTKFVVTSSGLGLFTLNGKKIKTVDIAGSKVVPLGVAHIPNINTFFVATRNIGNGKRSIYFSSDNGNTWSLLTHINGVDLSFFVGTGYQTIDNIKFFKRLIYQSFVLEVENNSINVNDQVLYDNNNVEDWYEDYKLEGIAITIDKSLYLLFNDKDIIQITDVDIKQDKDLNIIKPNVEDVKSNVVSGTADTTKYEIDKTNIGSAYNNTRYNNDVDDDFDINDISAVTTVLSNNKEDRIKVYTFRNAGRLQYIPDGTGGNIINYDESKPDLWVWQSEEDETILKLANYDTKGLYVPSILKPIEEVTLERYDKSSKSLNDTTEKWSDDLVSDKSEVIEIDGNIVYKGHDPITPSSEFLDYSDTSVGDVDYVAMAVETQEKAASEYKNIYPSEPITDDKTGKITYGKISKDFYEYITKYYKNDNTLQEQYKHEKGDE